jgi:DNA invertase Pin-like site-specific DNA recombinase
MSALVHTQAENAGMATCSVDGCERDAARGGMCWGHDKARREGQPLRPLRSYANPLESLRESAYALADLDSDGGSDREFRRLDQNLQDAAKRFGRRSFSEAVHEGMEAARARGAKIGRPALIPPGAAQAAVRMHGGVRKAAKALGVSHWSVLRAIFRCGAKR